MTTSTSDLPSQALPDGAVKDEIRAEALRLGFDACGFASAAGSGGENW